MNTKLAEILDLKDKGLQASDKELLRSLIELKRETKRLLFAVVALGIPALLMLFWVLISD